MTPDTLEGSIHDLTQNILADYTAGRPIDRIEPFNQPDRDVIIALIGKLRRIVFPGYFRDPAYHVYSAAHSLSMRNAGASRRFAEPALRSFAAK